MAEAIEQGRAHSRDVGRRSALAALLLLLGGRTVEAPAKAHDDGHRAKIVARTLASYWATRIMVVSRKAPPDAPFNPRELTTAAVQIDASVTRTATTETVEAFNAERRAIYSAVSKLPEAEGLREQWHAELDRRTCATCESLDGELSDIGGSFAEGRPPLHSRCRCWTEVIRKTDWLAAA